MILKGAALMELYDSRCLSAPVVVSHVLTRGMSSSGCLLVSWLVVGPPCTVGVLAGTHGGVVASRVMRPQSANPFRVGWSRVVV